MDLPPAKVECYLVRGGRKYGPLSDIEMLNGIDAGHLRSNDQLWRKGLSGWRSAKLVFPELYGAPVDSIIVGEPLVTARSPERRARMPQAFCGSGQLDHPWHGYCAWWL